jgi:chromosome segregation ATPase
MSRPSTAGSLRSTGRRSPGVKGTLQQLTNKVADHERTLRELTKVKEEGEDNTQEVFNQMQERVDKIMDEMRTEMTDKLKTAYVEIERLRKQLAIVKGEQTIHTSQLRDQSKGVQILERSVADLQRELNGDIDEYE